MLVWDTEKKQLGWRCRRGVRELDVLLENFLHRHYDQLCSEDKQLFSDLLEQQDPILLEWLVHGKWPRERSMRQLARRISASLHGD